MGAAYAAKAPLVLDADALNLLSNDSSLWLGMPPGTILTPHAGEYKRLFGASSDPIAMAIANHIYIISKGPGTRILTPDGRAIVNASGNPGMATAGSGDVLTGVLTGLLARGYPAEDACLLGVYLHGLAGDIAAVR
ncbi:MAG: NAD(P)H-hydrate dehydratase, partial [Chitinophagia bacterium]|nr:NAD(P)H-hydrate dehydratase [Chitinophagia bacterium]